MVAQATGEAGLPAVLDRIETDRLMSHIAEFAKRVKLSGSPEELESFAYLQSVMDGYGYRARLIFHDAFISLPGAARLAVDGDDLPCITHSMAVSTGPEGREGEVVYVGDGREEDFAALDLTGRIALIDGIAFEDTTERASLAGAIGQIQISPNEHRYEMCVSPVWGSPSQSTRDRLPRTAIVTVSNADGEALRKRCLAGERVVARLTTKVDTGWRKTPILVADLDCGAADAPFVLFSGHHDTWHYGVMDNGGANATMLEAARVLADRRGALRRNLRICFWSGHSHGRYSGSAWYADEFWIDLDENCAAHVNVDSTGGEGASVLTASGVVDELKHLAAEAVASETGQVHAGNRQGRAADQSFWGVGIPSMFGSLSHQPPSEVKMPVRLGWWWHTPHDLADHIDPENLTRDTRIVLRCLWALLTSPRLPLDYRAYATALAGELSGIDRGIGGRVDLTPLHSALDELTAALDVFDERISTEEASTGADRAMMRVSRALVPINYTSGERFGHDPAIAQPAWPALDGLRSLAALPAGSADELFHAVEARRTRNRITYALRQARAALTAAL